MKIHPSLILSFTFFVLWSCSDSGEPTIEGCTDSNGCNYSIDNTHDDGTCTYPTEYFDCDGNCIDELDSCGTCGGIIGNPQDCCMGVQMPDCAGECGGTAELDECNVCDGNNSSCVNYLAEIQPIFTANCTGCHDSSHSSGLDLTFYSSLINNDVIISGDHVSSNLWEYINSGYMPMGGNRLSSQNINLIATWIDEGALDN